MFKLFCPRHGLLAVFVLCACAQNYPVTNHCDGRRFFNQDANAQIDRSLVDVIRWKWAHKAAAWPQWRENVAAPKPALSPVTQSIVVTSINHATELIQMPGMTVLTDPVFSIRVSPLSWIGPKRVRAPGLALTELPKVDVVVISHNHYDHLDLCSLKQLAARQKPIFVVPLGNRRLLEGAGIGPVVELDWWQTHDVKGGGQITLVPAQHWSARGLFDRRRTLWGGYVLQAQQMQAYFAGDTGFGHHFAEIHARFGPMDVSLLPIGAYAPRWFMAAQHMDPEDAVRAHIALGSRKSLGMHFGTFQLTDEGIDAPIEALTASLKSHGLAADDFLAPANGSTVLCRQRAR